MSTCLVSAATLLLTNRLPKMSRLEPFGTIWSHVEPSGGTWNHIEPPGAIGAILRRGFVSKVVVAKAMQIRFRLCVNFFS